LSSSSSSSSYCEWRTCPRPDVGPEWIWTCDLPDTRYPRYMTPHNISCRWPSKEGWRKALLLNVSPSDAKPSLHYLSVLHSFCLQPLFLACSALCGIQSTGMPSTCPKHWRSLLWTTLSSTDAWILCNAMEQFYNFYNVYGAPSKYSRGTLSQCCHIWCQMSLWTIDV